MNHLNKQSEFQDNNRIILMFIGVIVFVVINLFKK